MLENLKKIRKEKGYTQERIARILNISLRHYQRIENNESIPNVYIAIKISEILKTDIKLLFQIKK